MRILPPLPQKTNAPSAALGAYRFHALFGVIAAGAFSAAFFAVPLLAPVEYHTGASGAAERAAQATSTAAEGPPPVVHLETPESVRAIYMTACVAGTPSFRRSLVSLVEETELNAIVIDVKDYTGGISFPTDEPQLASAVSVGCTAGDMRSFIAKLHERGIYVIGRITVFQDPYYARRYPAQAVQRESGGVWEDYKGLSYIDPGAREAWRYIAAVADAAYGIGFDELNFDYIRFPSDGDMSDVAFPQSGAELKASVIERFFAYLHETLKERAAYDGSPPVISADLFGMTSVHESDLNIGQVLERAVPHFDYIAPMVYPSHYPPSFNGWADPNRHPYEVVHYSLARAAERLAATSTAVYYRGAEPLSTSTEPRRYRKRAYSAAKLRPWLQDFDYGGDYGVSEVRAQIRAAYDAGVDSWMLWSPSNQYTRNALEPFYQEDVKPNSQETETVE